MGRQKPRSVLNLSQNHKKFKQRVHILNSALSNQSNIKKRNENEIDQDSFISLQTNNCSSFTPNLMECILFPIFQSSHLNKSHSKKSHDLLNKHSKRDQSKRKRKRNESNKDNNGDINNAGFINNFPLDFDINSSVFMNKSEDDNNDNNNNDYFINWQNELLIKEIKNTLKEYDNDNDIYIPSIVLKNWPSTYGDNSCIKNTFINYNFQSQSEEKESLYDKMMLKCAQKCYGDIIYKQLSFDDFTNFIDSYYNYHYWTYHQDDNDDDDKNKKVKKLHFNKKINELCKDINNEIINCYFKFLEKEIEFRLLIVMGNKRLLNTERSSHKSSYSLFEIQKRVNKILNTIKIINLNEIHHLPDNKILKWTKLIRDCIGDIDGILKDAKQLKYNIIEHLYQFPIKFKKYLNNVIIKIKQKNNLENNDIINKINEMNMIPLTLIYVYKTDEKFHYENNVILDNDNMYQNINNKSKNEYEVYIDLELCEFGQYLNYYRYILTVLNEFELNIINKYKFELKKLLKYVGGEIEGSIWNRQIWEERENITRIKKDEQLSKKLLFCGNNKQLTQKLIDKYSITLTQYQINKIIEIQGLCLNYIKQILNEIDIDPNCLAIHIKLNLLNNNDYVKLKLLKQIYDIIHDRDKPRGIKPEKSLKKIREKAKLLLLKKEEIKRKKMKKKIRIQTSEKHLSKLANIVPTASDIQKYSIIKQRQQRRAYMIAQKRKRDREIAIMQKNKRLLLQKQMESNGMPPELEVFDDEPPLKRRKKSQRIKDAGGYKSYVEHEIEQFVEYQFEFAIVSHWTEFLKSNLFIKNDNYNLNDLNQFKKLFETLFIGMHIDIEDEYHEWYQGIISKIRISKKKEEVEKVEKMEEEEKTQKNDDNNGNIDIFNKYNIKLRIHFKNFSQFWDTWIDLPSSRISVLRTYSNAYDVDDTVKPLPEIIRELDESQIISIDFIAQSLQFDKSQFVKWINSQPTEWTENENKENVNKILKWSKEFLSSNKQNMMISRDYFVKAGSYSDKKEHMICEAVLPNTFNVELKSLTKTQQNLIQDKVINNLTNKISDYFTMSTQCGIPLGLFQQIVFGITDLLPTSIIDQIINWSQGIHLENLDFAIKEERLFYVKIE